MKFEPNFIPGEGGPNAEVNRMIAAHNRRELDRGLQVWRDGGVVHLSKFDTLLINPESKL